jgi:pheromone shutdown protein TraB
VKLILVGVAHVLNIENRIIETMEKFSPDIIALELDERRYRALLEDRKMEKTEMEKTEMEKTEKGKRKKKRGGGAMVRILSAMEKKVADEHGIMPGDEMLTAAEYASENSIPLQLIDMDFLQTIKKIKEIGLIEKLKFFFSALCSIFIPGKRVEKEMEKMVNNYDSAIKEFEKEFPKISKALIDDRNSFMAIRLLQLLRFGNVLAVVGDAHIKGLEKEIRKMEKEDEGGVEIQEIRLRDLLN